MPQESIEDLLEHLIRARCSVLLSRDDGVSPEYSLLAVRYHGRAGAEMDVEEMTVLDVRAPTLAGLVLAADSELNGKEDDA